MPRKWMTYVTVACLGLTTGCGGPGGRISFVPYPYPLTPQAQALRAAAGRPLPLPRELAKTVQAPYIVEPGDVLLVQPADLDSPVRLPGDQAVLPDGTIQLGRYGRPMVAGKTVEDIEREVKGLIDAQTKDAGVINVRLVSRQSKVFYVLGEVNAPGSFVLAGRETALDAILVAGGLTQNASTKGVILVRPSPPEHCRTVLPVCYDDIVQIGDTATNYQIQPGDRIFVPSKGFHEQMGFSSKRSCPPCDEPQVPCTVLGKPQSK